jgi:galactokinase
LLIDCRDADVERVALPEDLAVAVVDSGVRRSLSDGRYAERRAACEAAAARIGVGSLRDAKPEQVADDPVARHVFSENERVQRMVGALRAGDLVEAGAVLTEGHESLRDDFAVSTPELDALVERMVGLGAYGARLTGGGFGGCVIAFTPRELAPGLADSVNLVCVQ